MLIGRKLPIGSRWGVVGILILMAGCGGNGNVTANPPPSGPPPVSVPRNVMVNWAPNREAAVNRAGGGYRVYYSPNPGVALGSATQIAVPYVSGTTAPTSTTVSLMPGTYYIRVVAYSTLNPAGSAASAEFQAVVPN